MLHEVLLLARDVVYSFELINGVLIGTHSRISDSDAKHVIKSAARIPVPLLVERELGQDRSQP